MNNSASTHTKPVVAISAAPNRAALTVTSAEIDTTGWSMAVVHVIKGSTDGTLDISFTHATAAGGSFVAAPVAYDFTQIAAGAAEDDPISMIINLENAVDLNKILKVEAITGGGTANNYAVMVELMNPTQTERQDHTYAMRPA